MLATLLATIDLLAVPVAMNFSGRERAKTKFGGLCSLIFFTFFFWTIIKGLQDFFSTNNPHIINSDSYTQDPKETIITSDFFPMAFQMRTPVGLDYTPYIDEKIYDLRAFHTILERITHPNGTIEEKWFEEELATEKCTLEHFGDIATSFADVNLNFTFCLARNQTIDKLSLQGAFISPIYKTVTIRVYQCKNTTTVKNCYPQEIINDYLGGSWFSTIFSNMVVNPKDYAHPNLRYRDQYYTMVHPNNYRETEIELGHVEISTDHGVLGESLETNTYVKVNKVTEFIQFDSNPEGIVISCIFQLSKLESYYSRVYKKITEIISEAGSLANTALVILLLITRPYFRLKFREKLMNELFDIRLPETKINDNRDQNAEIKINDASNQINMPQANMKKNLLLKQFIQRLKEESPEQQKFHTKEDLLRRLKTRSGAKDKANIEKKMTAMPFGTTLKISKGKDQFQNKEFPPQTCRGRLRSKGSLTLNETEKDQIKNIKSAEISLTSPGPFRVSEPRYAHVEKSTPIELKFFEEDNPEEPNFSFESPITDKTEQAKPITLGEVEKDKPDETEEKRLAGEPELAVNDKERWESQTNSPDSPVRTRELQKKRKNIKIDFKFWEFFSSFVYRPPEIKEKLKILNEGSKNIVERLDVINILKKLRQIDKLIVLLLDEDQFTLFNNLPNPELGPKKPEKLLTSISFANLKLKNTKFVEENVSEQEILEAYINLKSKPLKTKVDQKILDIFDEEYN